ncbi:hypothetical protein [Salibacterium aidingense]|uniref:hypothetical protein n=1 Tax=Salibacterium aidingense TaxID=384933 RepID=UPI000411A87C|nr:hypothetical protein [Salibacterium aidingense]
MGHLFRYFLDFSHFEGAFGHLFRYFPFLNVKEAVYARIAAQMSKKTATDDDVKYFV